MLKYILYYTINKNAKQCVSTDILNIEVIVSIILY